MSNNAFKRKLDKTQQKIMQLAESENWDELLILSQQRDKFIKEFFDDKSIDHNQNSTTKLLESVKSSDQLVADKLAQLKRKMIKNSLSLKNTQSAINSYRATQDN